MTATEQPARSASMGAGRDWGVGIEALAKRPTAYRDGLLQGQVLLVSGGGGSVGRATAILLSRLGADVMICGRDAGKLADTAAGVKEHTGREIATEAMTIRDPEAVARLLDKTWEHFGKLDVLINNAGGQFAQQAIDFSPKGWNAVIDTNLTGTWYMMQAAARKWRDSQSAGKIVNIVSTVSRGIPQQAHSCAARAGVIHLSMTVAIEWAPLGIQVNCLAPGTIGSEGLNNYPPEMLASLGKSNPMRKLGDVWDIAEGIVYLSGPTAGFITGEVLLVNGGSHLWGNTWPLGMPDHYRI